MARVIELPPEMAHIRPWVISDPSGRWLEGARRFAPQLTPKPLVASVTEATSDQATARIRAESKGVVLWATQPNQFAELCDCVGRAAIERPELLRLVAVEGLSNDELLVLGEFQVSAIVRHPEQLPGLKAMIRRYFA